MRALALVLLLASSSALAQARARGGASVSLPTIKRVALLGDSLFNPNYNPPYVKLPVVLHAEMGFAYVCDQYGFAGDSISGANSRWVSDIRDWPGQRPAAKDYDYLVVLIGINRVLGGQSSATITTELNSLYSDIMASGLGITLVPVTLLPFGNSAGWSAARQTVLEAVNTWIRDFATTNDLPLVDGYAGMGTPGTPEDLLAAADHDDGLHLSATGNAMLAELIAAAIEAAE